MNKKSILFAQSYHTRSNNNWIVDFMNKQEYCKCDFCEKIRVKKQ